MPRTPLARLIGALLLTAAMIGGTAACSSDASVDRLSATAFAEAIAKPGVTIVDVRTPDEFASGHIANAINIDVESADFAQRIAGLDAKASYAVYCRSGNRSRTAVSQMTDAGFTNVVELADGISGWSGAGQPVVTGP